MPLLHKKPFVKKPIPVGVSPNDKVFFCELTNEAFLDYDEYWERLVLCNAMVWTCEITSRPNLTYQEALDSEAKGLKFITSISPALRTPLLYLASLTRRGRQADVSEDVFNHCRDRYFPGEPVEAIVNKHWYDCKVIRVIYPTAQEIAWYEESMADSEDDVQAVVSEGSSTPMKKKAISDPLDLDGSESKPICLDDDEVSNADSDIQVIGLRTPSKNKQVDPSSPEKKDDYPPYATFKYEVEEVLAWDYKTCQRHIVSWEQIRRSKNVFTREKCKLFLKIATELTPLGYWQLKPDIARKYKIKLLSYKDFFPGNEPKFVESKSRKLSMSLSPRGHEAQLKRQKKEKKESSLREKKEEKSKSNGEDNANKKRGRPSISGEEKLSRKLERIKTKQTELNFAPSNAPRLTAEEAEKKRMEQQKIIEQREQHFAEMKNMLRLRLEKEKAEKKQERDVKKEQRRLIALEMKEWQKPKEDLTCGNHKPLPVPAAVACGVPNHLFGSFVSLLEFLTSFSDVLELHDVYPHGISFEMLENAIVTKEVAGVFNDVVQLLLGAVFSLQEEEAEEITADTTIDASLGAEGGAVENDQRAAAVKFASLASRLPSQNHSTSLHQLPLDALTLTEVVRLHILASGADNNANSQWRHFNRGGYKHLDDPGLQFKLDEPQIVKDLAVRSIFDCHIEEKLKILQLLMHQILTYASVRDRLEEAFDKIREVKTALREHQTLHRNAEREDHAARMLKKKEIRQKKLKIPGAASDAQANGEEPEDEEERKEREEKLEKSREKRKQEYSKKEVELLDQLMTLSAKSNPIPLGMDRAYRRYWVFSSLPGLFIEDDNAHPGTCYDVATKDICDVPPEECKETLARLLLEAKQIVAPEENIEEKANTSDKENDISALASPHVNGSLASPSASKGISESVANTITRVIHSPLTFSKAQKLLTPSNSVTNGSPKSSSKLSQVGAVGSPKSALKSSKDQSITKFFSKSLKSPAVNGETISTDALKTKTNLETDAKDSFAQSEATSSTQVTDSKIQLSNEAEIKHSSEDIKSELEIFGLCTANPETCPVHTQNNNRPKWSFFHKEEDIQALIDGLNERGERESALKHNLILFKSKIDVNIKNCPVFILNPTEDTEHDIVVRKSKRTGGKKGGDGDTNLNFPIGTPIDRILELTLRDMILEVEEKLFVGVLGRLQVPDRNLWRESVIGESSAKLECDKLSWGGKARIAQFKADIGLETGSNSCSSTNTSGDEIALEDATRNSVVRQLATALLQVAQSVDVKYLKPPLAETDKAKKKRTKAENRLRKLVEKRDKEREEQQKLENGANSDDSDSESEMGDSHGISSISDNTLRLPLERWELSLMSSVSFSQVFLHLATLDNSVTWSRSLTKTRCRICRKGGDHDKMLLCDGCDKGHHIYCLKPKLKSIPDGDWFCDICRPKIKAKSPKKNRTIYVEDDDEEEEDDDTEEEELDIEKNGDAEEDFEAAGQEDEEEEDGGFEDDVCDACRIGGTLILCDTCPRSFHRECAALKKIPRGNWSCPECTAPQIDRTRKTKSDDKSSKQSTEEGKSKRVIEGKGTKSQAAGERASNRRSAPSSPETDEDEISFSKRRRAHSRSPSEEVEVRTTSKRKRCEKQSEGTAFNGNSKKTRKGNASDLHFTALQTLLTDVTRHDDAWPFRKAVNKRQVPDYYQVVKKPMDLQTMKEKLVGSEYSTDAEFLADALLIFQNCQQYNMEDTDEYLAGVNLGKYFKKRARKLGLDIDTDHDELPPSKSKKLPGVKKKRQAI